MPPAPRKASATKGTAKKGTAKKTATKKAATKKTATKKTATTKTATGKAQSTSSRAGAAQSAVLGAAGLAQAGAEETLARIQELQNRLVETARRGGTAYLDAYEKHLASMLSLTERAAGSTQLTWATTLATTYADFVKRVNDAVLKAGRQGLS
jgi:hypothetical protein